MLSQQIDTNIDADDTVVLYPTYGQLERETGEWRISVRAVVYDRLETCRRKLLWLNLLQRFNNFHPREDQRDLFDGRVRAFIAVTRPGKRLALQIGHQTFCLANATRSNGMVTGWVNIPEDTVESLGISVPQDARCLTAHVLTAGGERSGHCGTVRLLSDTGTSVISDIDDTMKVTEVTCFRSLLENTFLREFQPVDGTAEVYRQWAKRGAAFHYVSSSPWQLFGPLQDLFDRAGFPQGTYHLKSFRIHDPMLRRFWLLRASEKAAVLKTLLQAFPRRQFVLVGDSGDHDPEIYGALAREFGNQVQSIFIRELPQRPMLGTRCRRSFRRVAPTCWRLFREARELPCELERERCLS